MSYYTYILAKYDISDWKRLLTALWIFRRSRLG